MRNGDKRTAEPSVSSLKPKNSFPLLSFSFLSFFFFFVNSRPVCFSPVAGHKCTQCNSTGIWRSSTLRLNLFPRMCVRLLLWEYMACNRFFVPFYPQKFTLLFRPFRFFFSLTFLSFSISRTLWTHHYNHPTQSFPNFDCKSNKSKWSTNKRSNERIWPASQIGDV